MNILVNVINQKLKIKANTKRLVSGTQKFIRFEFSFDDAWDDLLVFAQFIQNGKAYNDYLDENNSVYLPPEITEGKFNVLLYGSGSNVIATTNYLTFEVDKNMLVSDAQSTEITESLYNKLVNIVKTYASQSASGAPTPVSSSSLMTDHKTIYLYTGSEDNYIKGDWYYFSGGQLQHGGTYGVGVTDSSLTIEGVASDSKAVGDEFESIRNTISGRFPDVFKTVDGLIETPGITNGTWAKGGAASGGNRGRTTSLIRCRGKISFGLGDYTKYKFGYFVYTSSDLTQYTSSGWVTADVSNLDFSGYAIGFNFAHSSGSGAIPASELEEIHNLFSISVTGQMFTLREEIETLQSDVVSLKSAESAHENNLLPQIGANPFRFNPCYDHLFVNSKTDAVIPHESLYHVRLSKKFGFDVIEANVSATSDGVYVVNHLENYKFGNYFHHADGTTDISNTLLSSVTWDWVVENVRYNSTIAKYQTRPCRLEEFLQECRQQNLIPFITSSDTNVIAIADQYMGKDNYIAYGASRADCPHAIIYHWVSNLTTKDDILAYCENVGKPFIFGLGNVSDFTDAGLKELVETLHENGYMIGISYSDNNVHKYSAFGFDAIGTIRHINRIENGNLCNLNSAFNFSDFEYTNATLSNGILTFSSAGTIKPKIESINYPFCGFDIEFDMTGTVTIPAVGEQKSPYNLTSDGTCPVFCATPIINGSPAITINVASGTVIRDVFFKASVFARLENVPVIDPAPTRDSPNAVSSGGVYEALHNTDTTFSQSGQAADAEAVSYLLEYTENIFNLDDFLPYGWERTEKEVSGALSALSGSKFLDEYSFEAETAYTLSLEAYNTGNVSAGSNNGLRIRIYYTDSTYTELTVKNNTLSYRFGALITDPAKTVDYINIGYSNSGGNIWHIRNIMLAESAQIAPYTAYRSCVDTVARNKSDITQDVKDNYVWDDLTPTLANGYVLDGTGTCVRDTNGQLVKYAVTAGQILWLNIGKYAAGVYQFQVSASVNSTGSINPSIIGRPCVDAVNDVVIVPDGATYLIASQSVNNPACCVRIAQLPKVLPAYWEKYIDAKAREISRQASPPVGNGTRFAFITDVHLRNADGSFRNAGYSPLLMQYLHEHCNIGHAFFGGDTLTGSYASLDDAMDDLMLFRNTFSPVWDWMYSVFGNHEYGNNSSSLSAMDKSIIYNALIRDKERDYAAVNPVYGSYVLDNVAEKIRFICLNLNEGNNLTQQNNFFCSALRDTPSGWTIIFITHFTLENNGGTVKISTKLTNANSIVPAIEAYNARQVYGNYDFTSAGAEVACVIGGHTHWDGMVKTPGGVPVIAVSCDMHTDITGVTAGTTTEQCFDVFTIDTSAKTISTKRIGYGSDRVFTYGTA